MRCRRITAAGLTARPSEASADYYARRVVQHAAQQLAGRCQAAYQDAGEQCPLMGGGMANGLKLNIPRQVVSRWRKRFFDLRLLGLQDRARPGRPSVFPPDIVVRIKALACASPRESGLPLSRFSNSEIAAEATRRGIVAEISDATIWRWLNQDAIRPWQFRSWIFPRDPRFEEKAGPVLDLYQGLRRGVPLHPDDMVICADEKPSIQARQRKHVRRGPRPRQPMRVEHEY